MEVSSDGKELVVTETNCSSWNAVNGQEPLIGAVTPKSDLFLDRLGGSFVGTQMTETLQVENGVVTNRAMVAQKDLGWRGSRSGVDMHGAAVLDYFFKKGAAEGGTDIAYARYGSWESASGLLDYVTKAQKMMFIESAHK